MKTYRLHRSMGYCPISIAGEDIIAAISKNFKTIAEETRIGNVAGYKLVKVVAEYRPCILGGKGGCVVYITATGQPLVNGLGVGSPEIKEAWIGGVSREELPEPYEFELK